MCDDGPMAQRPRGGFRYIDMTPNAWAAVIVPGAVAGLTAGRLWSAPLALTMTGGVVLSYLLALAVDRRAGARALVTIDVSDLPEPSLEALTARLGTDGVAVTVRRWNDPGADSPDVDRPGADKGAVDGPRHAALRVPSRHRLQAEAALEAERQRLTGGA